MERARARRWRIGLTIASGALLAVATWSCFRALYTFHANASLGGNDFAVKRAAIYWTHAPPAPTATTWRWFVEPSVKRPKVALLPTVRVTSGGAGGFVLGWSGVVCLPLWVPLVLLGTPCVLLWRKRMRRPAWSCAGCGYDLRGTPGPACPECGKQASERREARRGT